MQGLEKKAWWGYLEEDLQELLQQSFLIKEFLLGQGADLPGGRREFHDYSFVVFPAAKAYEGFLKKLFLDLNLITENDYYGKHFRIGKALNPSLPEEIRNESIYGKLTKCTGDNKLADLLWETWKRGRNLLFHWFPKEKNAISLSEAQEILDVIVNAIEIAYKECKMDTNA